MYPSGQGSASFSQHRHRQPDPVTNQPRSIIENWGDKHRRNNVWYNDEAAATYARMEVERNRLTQQTSSSSASASTVDEGAIAEAVMGARRGHKKGVGPTMPRRSQHPSSAAGSQYSYSSHQPTQPTIPADQLAGWMEQMYNSWQEMVGQVSQVNPNFVPMHPLPRPPGVSYGPRPVRNPPPPSSEEEDEEDENLGNS